MEGLMRAAEYRQRGPAEAVLALVDLPVPEPGPGEVRVRIMASAVNTSDTKSRSLRPGDTAMAFPAITPHQDGSGVIDAIGKGVDAGRLGERVWLYMAQRGRARGTAAEYCTIPAERAVPLPAAASFTDGACLGIPAMTAHYALFADGPVLGKVVLVQGAAGAVGFYAVQIAKWAGAAKVIATVSRKEQAERAILAGADIVIDRHSQDVAALVRAAAETGVDRIIEVAFGANLSLDLAILARNGAIVSYASDRVPEPQVPVRALMAKDAVLRFVLIYEAPQAARDGAARDINLMIEQRRLQHQIADILPLSAIVEAHQRMEAGATVGKLLVDPRR